MKSQLLPTFLIITKAAKLPATSKNGTMIFLNKYFLMMNFKDYAFGYDYEKGFRDDMLVVKLDEKYEVLEITNEG